LTVASVPRADQGFGPVSGSHRVQFSFLRRWCRSPEHGAMTLQRSCRNRPVAFRSATHPFSSFPSTMTRSPALRTTKSCFALHLRLFPRFARAAAKQWCNSARIHASACWLALVEEGTESRGQAGVTGLPGQRQPAVSMHSPRLGIRAYVRGCIDHLGVEEPSAERGQQVVVPEGHAFPAPVARNSSWPPSPGCGPPSAPFNRDKVKICGRNLHNRLWLLLGDLRQLERGLLLFCVGCCSLVSPHSTPLPHLNSSAPYSQL
jgi:hypothetical protein